MVIDVNRLETDVSLLLYDMSFIVVHTTRFRPAKQNLLIWFEPFFLKTFKHNV